VAFESDGAVSQCQDFMMCKYIFVFYCTCEGLLLFVQVISSGILDAMKPAEHRLQEVILHALCLFDDQKYYY